MRCTPRGDTPRGVPPEGVPLVEPMAKRYPSGAATKKNSPAKDYMVDYGVWWTILALTHCPPNSEQWRRTDRHTNEMKTKTKIETSGSESAFLAAFASQLHFAASLHGRVAARLRAKGAETGQGRLACNTTRTQQSIKLTLSEASTEAEVAAVNLHEAALKMCKLAGISLAALTAAMSPPAETAKAA